MPLLKIQTVGGDNAWGLWLIRETESELSFQAMESVPEDIVNPKKRLEWLCGRVLIKSMLERDGLQYHGLKKDEFGKPYLLEHFHNISLSHSYPYVAAQIDRNSPVGIDLEQPKQKLKAIAHRIFNPAEVKDAGDNLVKLCIYWCAKEALYKIYGRKNLHFTENLLIEPFVLSNNGPLRGKIRTDNYQADIKLEYIVSDDFVMVYTDTKIL